MEKNLIKKYGMIGLIAAAVYLFVKNVNVVLGVLRMFFSAASPLIFGIVAAYILNILLKKIESTYFPKSRKTWVIRSRRPVSILLSFAALIVIAVLLVNLVVPELAMTIRLMAEEIPPAFEAARLWAIENSSEIPAIQESLRNLNIDWETTIRKVLEVVVAGAGGIFTSVVSVVSSMFSAATTLLIGSIFAVYLLSAKEKLIKQSNDIMRAYLKPEIRKKILYVVKTIHETFSSFIVGQLTEAVIIGTLCAIGMTILKMPYAVMTGTVVGVTALIPVVGAYVGAAVGAFMVFTVNPLQAVIFVVFLIILQQMEGNLIYPKVVGASIGLPGLWVLAAVTIGGGMFGIGGMLLGVPITAAFYKLLRNDVEKRIRGKK